VLVPLAARTTPDLLARPIASGLRRTNKKTAFPRRAVTHLPQVSGVACEAQRWTGGARVGAQLDWNGYKLRANSRLRTKSCELNGLD
jgi:hypothetical protein